MRTPGTRTVLVLEDDEASQYIFGTILRHHGYQVLEARRTEEGLRVAREHMPDLVVVDIGLPEISGLEFLRKMKESPETREIPLLVVTVHVYEQERKEALEAGCDFFLPKPLVPSDLAREVERILGPPRCSN
jgi:two-component system, cell cycle response regulator DivK